MTILRTRLKEIRAVEQVRLMGVRNVRTEKLIATSQNGFKAYPKRKKLADSKNVTDLIDRFEQAYPGYTCDVAERRSGKWRVAHGNKKMRNVRATY